MVKNHIQIYKSDVRGCEESDVFRRYSTFNFDTYQDDSRKPFGTLLALNDETLAPRESAASHITANTDILLLPLVGGLIYKDSLGNNEVIGTEEIRLLSAQAGTHFEVSNPYENDLVNYLQIWLKPTAGCHPHSQQKMFEFAQKNMQIPLFAPDTDFKITSASAGSISLFEGRNKGSYTLKKSNHGLFAFVIYGAFEFEERLLESRDGISVCGLSEVHFEALSENAILLLLEIEFEP